MDMQYICCLCFRSCNGFKIIQNERGESTECYNVTVKYFDPMILGEDPENINMNSSSKVICDVCWEHINNFHEFQQSVLKARTVLLETKNQKIDVYSIQELPMVSEDNMKLSSEDGDVSDIQSEDFDSNNEDVPLKTVLRQTRLRTRAKSLQYKAKTKLKKVKLNSNSASAKPHNDKTESDVDKKMDTSLCTDVNQEETVRVKCEVELSADSEQFSDKPNVEPEGLEHNKDLQVKPEEIDSIAEETTMPPPTTKRQSNVTKIEKNKIAKLKQCGEKKASSDKIREKRKEDDLFIAQWKPILDCDLCSATVSNFDEMRNHFATTHNTRYYIKCCERKFYRRYALITHIRLHVNPETYKCDICGRSSTTKHNLHLHKKIVHSQSKEFECDICHKLFNQKPNLERHLLIHVEGEKKFFCKDCGRGYVLEVQLKSHIKSVHEVNNICDQCGRIFHGQSALRTHMMEHSGIKRRRHPCDICGVEIVSKSGLKRHKAAFHHDGSTAYVCGVCGKVTSSENALVHHKKYVHEKEKKHKCTYCDKAFMKPKGLREHIATHTGVDLYQCPHCPQTFKVSANMHHHRKRAHPVEWEEARKNKVILPKINLEQCTNHVVL